MLRMGKQTKLTAEEVIAKATAYFGPGGVGLTVRPTGPHAVEYVGGGGYVHVQAEPSEDESQTEIDIQSREWEYDVRRFLKKL